MSKTPEVEFVSPWKEAEEAISLIVGAIDGGLFAFPYVSLSHVVCYGSDVTMFFSAGEVKVTFTTPEVAPSLFVEAIAGYKVSSIRHNADKAVVFVDLKPDEDEEELMDA